MIKLSHPRALSSIDLESLAMPAGSDDVSRAPGQRHLLGRELTEWRGDLEREYLLQLFVETDGDIRSMTARLGVKTTRFYAWLKELGLDPRELRQKLRQGKLGPQTDG